MIDESAQMPDDFYFMTQSRTSQRTFAILLGAFFCVATINHGHALQKEVSEDEYRAAKKVENARDATDALNAAADFVKSYPKTTIKAIVANKTAAKITEVKDPAQKAAFAEKFLTIFTTPPESEIIYSTQIDAYIKSGRDDDAFKAGAAHFEKHPDDAGGLTILAWEGVDQLKKKNPAYAAESVQYANQAVKVMESGSKPADFTEEQWKIFKASWLPKLYQAIGLISMMSGDDEEARAKLEKSLQYDAKDPGTYMLLGEAANNQYRALAAKTQGMSAGPEREADLKKALEQMDHVIQYDAQAVALSEGRAEYKPLHDQLMENLTEYYKYRHNGSTEGLQQLLDSYKKSAK